MLLKSQRKERSRCITLQILIVLISFHLGTQRLISREPLTQKVPEMTLIKSKVSKQKKNRRLIMRNKIVSHKLVLYLSIANLILFVTNTFFLKFLDRDLFYLTGLYLPVILILLYLLFIIFSLIKKMKSFFALQIFILTINIVSFSLYTFYMSRALMVR